jgi:hypothetical protein
MPPSTRFSLTKIFVLPSLWESLLAVRDGAAVQMTPLATIQVFQPADGRLLVQVRDLWPLLTWPGHQVRCAGPADVLVKPDPVGGSRLAYVEVPIVAERPTPSADRATYRALVTAVGGTTWSMHGTKPGSS